MTNANDGTSQRLRRALTTEPPLTVSQTRIKQFTPSKQREYFKSLQNSKFSGRLIISDCRHNTWVFYWCSGGLVYATGGKHAVRRWRRNFAAYVSERAIESGKIRATLANVAREELKTCWEYKLLSLWVASNQISPAIAHKIIEAIVVEILFDITQGFESIWETINDDLLATKLINIVDVELVIERANKQWQSWQHAKIADRSPNLAPIIRQPATLRQQTSAKVYQNLLLLLDGKHTLRDLSLKMKRDAIVITRSLLPYVQSGLIQLVEIKDIPPPVPSYIARPLIREPKLLDKLIACIDDSQLICQTLESIVTQAGYQFVSETDGLRAIASMLRYKPSAIFLDLVMPNTNGYEICSQLRKLSFFRNTPIIILTGNDGILDRVRAKMVGSTDFMSKPIQAELVMAKLGKYLTAKV